MNPEIAPIPDVSEALREAAQLGKLVPFVGAGASKLAGCPDWDEFANGALRRLLTTASSVTHNSTKSSIFVRASSSRLP
jgi:hypothetical protein